MPQSAMCREPVACYGSPLPKPGTPASATTIMCSVATAGGDAMWQRAGLSVGCLVNALRAHRDALAAGGRIPSALDSATAWAWQSETPPPPGSALTVLRHYAVELLAVFRCVVIGCNSGSGNVCRVHHPRYLYHLGWTLVKDPGYDLQGCSASNQACRCNGRAGPELVSQHAGAPPKTMHPLTWLRWCRARRDVEDVQHWLADASSGHSGHWLVAGAHSLTSRMALVCPRDEGRLVAQVCRTSVM